MPDRIQRAPWLFSACILAGFALIKVPVAVTFLKDFAHIIFVIGVLVVLIFAFALIYLGILALIGRK